MKKVRFQNGYETELDDKIAELYKKKGRVEIIGAPSPKKEGIKNETP